MLGILQTLPPVPFHYAKWTPPGQLFAVAVYNGPPRSTLRRGKWTPLGKLGILQTLPPVPFHYAKWTPCPFSPVEYGPPGQLYAVVNGPPRKVRNIANGIPGPFSTVENGPGGPFSTGENGPGVHFQR